MEGVGHSEAVQQGSGVKIIYFIVGDKRETAVFSAETPQELIIDLFRSAAEAGPRDVIKLYNQSERLVVISSQLPCNTPEQPYHLQVVGRYVMQTIPDSFAEQLHALQVRVASLERSLPPRHNVCGNNLKAITSGIDSNIHEINMLVNKIQNDHNTTWLSCSRRCGGAFRETCTAMQRRRISLPKHCEVKAKFTQISDVTLTTEMRTTLRLPEFDSYAWSDEEVLLLMYSMFSDLGLLEEFHIPPTVLRAFLYEVYKHYNEVPFHNFRHCFCVAQMMYSMATRVGLVDRVGPVEMLVLLVSCICHDLDHPGYNNIYQINARTELAIRYNDISPLENHHCSVAFRILEIEECNILSSLSSEMYRHVREGIIRCILATDMARHNEILAQFKEITPTFDYTNKSHTNLLSMVLIKVADISNEARPLDVAEPWLDRLLQEFFAQSAAEKEQGLPVTPFMDPDKISRPSSQVRFIGLVLLPLFEALGDHMPELDNFIVQPVKYALEYYRRLNEATRPSRKSVVDGVELAPSSGQNPLLPISRSSQSVKSRRSIPSHRSLSRSTDGSVDVNTEHLESIESLDNLQEGNESGDSETATEVEVSEKTLKFKISTESSCDRKSYPGSRKGSRERSQLSSDLEKAVQRNHNKDRKSSLGFSSSGSIGNYCSCNIDRARSRNSDGSLRSADAKSPCSSEFCQKILQRQISEEKEYIESTEPSNHLNGAEIKKILTPKSSDSELKMENVIKNTNFDEIVIEKSEICENMKQSEDNKSDNGNRSFFARIKQFTDRISISFDKQQKKSGSCSNSNEQISSKNQKTKKDSPDSCNKGDIASVFGDNKASTLPKFKKSDSKRTWRFLMYNKDRTTNSLETLTQPTDVAIRKNKISLNPDNLNHKQIKDDSYKASSIYMQSESKSQNELQAQSLVGNRGRVEI